MLVRPYACVMFTNQLHTWPKLRVVDKGGVYSEVVTAHILKNKIIAPPPPLDIRNKAICKIFISIFNVLVRRIQSTSLA